MGSEHSVQGGGDNFRIGWPTEVECLLNFDGFKKFWPFFTLQIGSPNLLRKLLPATGVIWALRAQSCK